MCVGGLCAPPIMHVDRHSGRQPSTLPLGSLGKHLEKKWEWLKMRTYSREFRMQVVRRILNGEKVPALAQELGIHRKLLYEWMRRVNEGGESNLRERGRPRKDDAAKRAPETTPKQIAELERAIAHQQLIIEFFRLALQRVEELRHRRNKIGAMASFARSTE